jgi:hypothetical protein
LRSADAAVYEKAAIRWLGRFALEHPGATLAMLHQAVAAFERLPDDPEAARAELVALIRRKRILLLVTAAPPRQPSRLASSCSYSGK